MTTLADGSLGGSGLDTTDGSPPLLEGAAGPWPWYGADLKELMGGRPEAAKEAAVVLSNVYIAS